MLRHLLLCIWISGIAASSAPRIGNALGKLSERLGRRLQSSSSTTSRRYSASATQSSNVTESRWPSWRLKIRSLGSNQTTTTTNSTVTVDEKESPEPPQKKPKWTWRRPTKTTDKVPENEEQSKKEKTPSKEEDAKKEEAPAKSKKEESKPTQDKGGSEVKEGETDAAKSNSTDVASTNATTGPESPAEQDRQRREALERYKELSRLRQQILSSRDGRVVPMAPEDHYRQMRNAESSLAMIQLVSSLVALGIRYTWLMWVYRHLGSRLETIRPIQHFVFERLNDRFLCDSLALRAALDEPPLGASKLRWGRVLRRRNRVPQIQVLNGQSSLAQTYEKTAVVIELGQNSDADMDMRYLADLVTFLLSQHKALAFGHSVPEEKPPRGAVMEPPRPLDLEIIFRLNSPGGSVATFGLAAAQLKRLRGVEGITTTVCVDMFAASGGYMIASQANKLVAAPFAYVGSIGVIMETLNFHDILRSYGVTPVVLKAGAGKNPLTTYGAITKTQLSLEQERLEKVHELFKRYTIEGRPQLEGLEGQVCDGSVFMGSEALQLNLVDEVMTSDEYLMQRMQAGDRVLKVYRSRQSRIAPHMRFPTAQDILPHLKSKLESFLSSPDTATKLVRAGSFVGLLHHLVSKYVAKGMK